MYETALRYGSIQPEAHTKNTLVVGATRMAASQAGDWALVSSTSALQSLEAALCNADGYVNNSTVDSSRWKYFDSQYAGIVINARCALVFVLKWNGCRHPWLICIPAGH